MPHVQHKIRACLAGGWFHRMVYALQRDRWVTPLRFLCRSEDKVELPLSGNSEDRAFLETGAASTLSSISQIGTWSCGGSAYATQTSLRSTSASAARPPGLSSSKRFEIHQRSPRRMKSQVKVALHWIARKVRNVFLCCSLMTGGHVRSLSVNIDNVDISVAWTTSMFRLHLCDASQRMNCRTPIAF
jgi:hypothetical protein